MTRLATIAKGLSSALLLLAVVAGLPAVLIRIGAFPRAIPDLPSLWRSATGPDPAGRAVFAVLAVLAWGLWAAFTISVLREIGAAIRTRGARTARPVPGLDWSARPAALLIAAIVAMFVAAPLLTAAAPYAAAAGLAGTGSAEGRQPTAATAVHRPGPARHSGQPTPQHPGGAAAAERQDPAQAHQGAAVKAPSAGHTRYTVQRHDTLWSIAERQLGDPLRYTQIAALNPHIGPDHEIRPGQDLTLPADARRPATSSSGSSATHVTVAKGDTLSGIAAEHGRADWRTVWLANAGRSEPGGKALTNPDHIEPGWDLTVTAQRPAPAAPVAAAAPTATAPPTPPAATTTPPPAASPQVVSPTPAAGRHDPPEQEQSAAAATAPGSSTPRTPTATASATPTPASSVDPAASPAVRTEQRLAPTVAGFAAGGAVLAAGVFAALAFARRQQFRDRRPGRTIASTGPDLVPVERATVTVGGPAAADVARLDEVLRRIAATDTQTLHVAAVQLTSGDITLHLAAAAELADPWRSGDAAGLIWTFAAAAEARSAGPDPDEVGAIAPYPTLVSIGSDATSSWLLDLEQAGGLVLTGDSDRCLDLARVMAGQLGLNPWADAVSVTMLGFGRELLDAAPGRLRYAPPGDADAVLSATIAEAVRTADFADENHVGVVEGRRRAVADETWAPQVLLVGGETLGADDILGADKAAAAPTIAGLLELVDARPGATGTAVVFVAADLPGSAAAGGTLAHLSADGTLTLPNAGLSVVAGGWDEDTARGVAMLLAHARTAPDEKVPDAAGGQPWQAYSDAAGALREQLVQPRATPDVHDSNRASGSSCTLPLADEVYLDAAATTRQDLQTLAPSVPAHLRPQIANADPALDDDVDAWFDASNPRAKLNLLGPLSLRIARPSRERPAFYAELTAYLATKEYGASVDEIADAFTLAPGSVRKYLKSVRDLLGDDPETGQPYLPHADKSPAAKTRGVNIYQITGLLIDADLFRRLRLRGDSRGADGIPDYLTALRLVTGEPFSQMRPGGGAWLAQGARLDHHLIVTIVDTAHLVATHALAAGDTRTARAAIEIARVAAPYEETPRLDEAAVDDADGLRDQARRIVAEDVCNRSDDGQPPMELNERTKEILARHHNWLSRAS